MANINNKSEYSPGKFSMDLTEVDWDENNEITNETFPIYAHEYCHYIQDISTISGISGFYYKIIDLAELTKITCDSNGKIIKIPIEKDLEGYPIKKNKNLYAYYCGHVITLKDVFTFDPKVEETTEISIGNIKLNIPLFRLNSQGHSDILVGTYALQESHAFYIQKLIETEINKDENKQSVDFKIPAESLPLYPYRFVDYLFDLFNLKATSEIKAYLIELCLDTFLPMVTLIKVLELLKENGMTTEKNEINNIVTYVLKSLDFPPSKDIQNTITEFLNNLIEDNNRDYFRKGVTWYLDTINKMREIRNMRSYWIADALASYKHIKGFMSFYQPPFIIKNNQIVYLQNNLEKPGLSQDVLDSVTALFLYMHIFSLVTEFKFEEFNKLVCCPLFQNCNLRKEIKSDYRCKTSPWKISEDHKEKGKVCFYRKALIELGFEQNQIEVDFNESNISL